MKKTLLILFLLPTLMVSCGGDNSNSNLKIDDYAKLDNVQKLTIRKFDTSDSNELTEKDKIQPILNKVLDFAKSYKFSEEKESNGWTKYYLDFSFNNNKTLSFASSNEEPYVFTIYGNLISQSPKDGYFFKSELTKTDFDAISALI